MSAPNQDCFALFGFPRAFALDLADLEARHRELSKASHPDKFVGALPEERRRALTQSLEISEAYRALRNEISRAEACFALAGLAIGDGVEPAPQPNFLFEIMSAREELADARSLQSEPARARIKVLAAANAQRIAALHAQLARVLVPDATADNLRSQLRLLGELRYFVRLRDEVQDATDDLDGLGHT